jgi:hypothetical protein
MITNNAEIIVEFRENVQEIYPDAEVHAYTSRAYEAHQETSNYNVLVMLNEVNAITYEIIHKIAWKIGSKYNNFLLPIITQKYDRPLYPPHLF